MSNTPPDDATPKPKGFMGRPVDSLDGDTDRTLSIVGRSPVKRLDVQREPPLLLQERGPGAPRTIRLTRDRLVIGRSSKADLTISSSELSREHVVLQRKGKDEYSCTDLDSKNGVYLNGIKVASAVLRDGDTVQLGDVVFLYRESR